MPCRRCLPCSACSCSGRPGSTLGLVLAVVGTGIWLGVQHLNYLEFGELRRVAQRTIDQRQIVINNLSVRRAVEELKVAAISIRCAASWWQPSRAMISTRSNCRPSASLATIAVQRKQPPLPLEQVSAHGGNFRQPSWKLTLDLVTTRQSPCGSLVVFRIYSDRDLQLDVNLLTSEFPATLADALDRVWAIPDVLIAAQQSEMRAYAANV